MATITLFLSRKRWVSHIAVSLVVEQRKALSNMPLDYNDTTKGLHLTTINRRLMRPLDTKGPGKSPTALENATTQTRIGTITLSRHREKLKAAERYRLDNPGEEKELYPHIRFLLKQEKLELYPPGKHVHYYKGNDEANGQPDIVGVYENTMIICEDCIQEGRKLKHKISVHQILPRKSDELHELPPRKRRQKTASASVHKQFVITNSEDATKLFSLIEMFKDSIFNCLFFIF
ncbi:hypothetical protein BC829DRAFT_435597 [Chytridium lagenaria]|nr:hypothetical protein BC829DRAFT_435597 [Chytridium lagenaria]